VPRIPTAAACAHCVARSALVHTSRASSGAYLSFDIKPLIDLDISFAMGRDRLPA